MVKIVVGRSGTHMLTNEAGEVTSHLVGMFSRTIRLLEAGIKPVYVFDGQPPDLKKQELAKRYSKRADATNDLSAAIEKGDEEGIEKFSKRTVKVTRQHNEGCKKLLGLMGVPVVEAPSEAEAQCASLFKNGEVYAVASEDMDTLTFGASRFLRHLMEPRSKKIPVMEFEMEKVLEELSLTMDQFIDMCILSGCDYRDNIKGFGELSCEGKWLQYWQSDKGDWKNYGSEDQVLTGTVGIIRQVTSDRLCSHQKKRNQMHSWVF